MTLYTREDMARAFDEGMLAMSHALQGGNEPVNHYRSVPPEKDTSAECFLIADEINALPRCTTCGGVYGLECPPHVTPPDDRDVS